jgi:RluA family pseudouridine synthase
MSGRKKPLHIPPGAPGHPRLPGTETGPRGYKSKEDGPEPRTEPRSKPRREGKPGPAAARSHRVDFLYEDEDLVFVDKPEGLPVIAAEGSRAKSLYDIVTERIRQKNPKGRAAVVHRLDRESSGVLVFAKSAKAKTRLMSRWDEMARERLYVALVEGEFGEAEGRLESWLAEAGPSRMRMAEPGERGALKAVTHYRVLGAGKGYSLLELSLETGRKHQIRVQLAGEGHPIAGDERYGSHRDPLGRLCLHASLLVLEQPTTGEILRVESPVPPGFAAALKGPGKSPRG